MNYDNHVNGHRTCPCARPKGDQIKPMVLRCPRCSALKFFGRTQVLGELVVCPKCGVVFPWREAEGTRPGKRRPAKSDDEKSKRAKR